MKAYFTADRGYDDSKLILKLWNEHNIKPIIDIRNHWKDSDETRLLTGKENIVYNYCGTLYCYCPRERKRREMAYGGFEKDRGTLFLAVCSKKFVDYGKMDASQMALLSNI